MKKPEVPVEYAYLVVSERIEDIQNVDMLLIQNFEKSREKLKKKARAGLGLEVLVSQARGKDARGVATWLSQVRKIYKFSKLVRCQFVLSSGATSPYSMVSGRCLDALLGECGIDPSRYWTELERWLESRLAERVTTR